MRMKKISRTNLISIIIFAIMAVVLSTSLFGCQILSRFTGGSNTATTETGAATYTVNKGTITQSISATGTVGSSETKNLSVQISGEVLQSTDAGTQVKKGDVLLKIDNTALLSSIKQAQINVEVAEVSLKSMQLSYQAALDANHVAIQVSQLDNLSSQQDVDAALSDQENTERAGNTAIENAQLSLEKAQNNFNFSIAQAQVSLNQASDSFNNQNGSYYSYQGAYLSRDSAIASATNSLDSATASLSEADAQAQANNETANTSYEKALISQSKTYWNTLSSLQQAKAKIESTMLSISTSQKQIDLAKISLDNTSKNLDKDVITAPFDGVILTATYNKGDYISENPTAISIASNDFIVKSSVTEADISKVSIGNVATIKFDAYPDQVFKGEIDSISGAPTVSNNITSYAITVKLTDMNDLKLFYGLTTDLTVVTAEAKDVLMVPVQAVYTENGKQYVDVLVSDQTATSQTGNTSTEKSAPSGTPPNGSAPSGSMPTGTFPSKTQKSSTVKANQKSTGTTSTKKVEITTGITDYTYYEVKSGLKEGDVVVTSAE
jgi:HlyD family secretion protein